MSKNDSSEANVIGYPRMMKVIAIDLGATSGRVMVVTHHDHRFSLEEVARFANRTYLDAKGYLRWDFSYLLSNIKKGIFTALEKHPDVSSIGIDTWGVDYGLLKDEKLLNDPICYRDSHSFESQKKILAEIPFSSIYSLTGIQNLHFNTIYQLAADPTDFSNVDDLLLIPDLIAFELTGAKRMEETNASTTSLYLRNEGKISDQLLKLTNVPNSIFPPMIHVGETYGYLKEEYTPSSLKKRIAVIAAPTHDTASAVLGAAGVGNFAYISSGTWSLIGTELKEPIMNEQSRAYNFTNEIGYPHTIRFLKNTMGMFLLNEIRNDYKKKGIDIKVEDIVPLAEKARDVGFSLDVDDPLFEQPGDMLSKLNQYLKENHHDVALSVGETIKLVYRSMAKKYKTIVEQLEELTHVKMNSILVVGGGNQASLLNQYIAEECNIDVITGASEATVIGNALSQLIALQEIPSVEEGRKDIRNSFPSFIYQSKSSFKGGQ